MSIPVPLEQLCKAIDERGGRAYLLTVSDDARPHAVHVSLAWQGDALATEVGTRSARNIATRPAVSLLYPARDDADYSLILDGTASVDADGDGRRVLITPTKAVLHRPAAAPDTTSSCGSDCVPLLAEQSAKRSR